MWVFQDHLSIDWLGDILGPEDERAPISTCNMCNIDHLGPERCGGLESYYPFSSTMSNWENPLRGAADVVEEVLANVLDAWDRFYKTPCRPKAFRIIFHPQILDHFPLLKQQK
jgi:hypothetical protein